MIHKVYANKDAFKTVEFRDGLNIVLADRTEASSDRDTRNGLGKSTLIDIIDFCLGARVPQPGKGFRIPALEGWVFSVELSVAGKHHTITRSVDDPGNVYVSDPASDWPVKPSLDEETGKPFYKWQDWNKLLGSVWFGLSTSGYNKLYSPSYRSLMSYLIRTGTDAYSSPFKHFPQQHTWDAQLHTAFLLGLGWENASDWQEIRDKNYALKALRNALDTGVLYEEITSVGELEARKAQLEAQFTKKNNAISNFRVHPQYQQIQQDADDLTRQIHNLTNENLVETQRLRKYTESLDSESPPENSAIERVYKEAGLVFGDQVKTSLEAAKSFHSTIIANRQDFLANEITRLKQALKNRDREIEQLTNDRAELMSILQSHGAFEEFSKLQKFATKMQEELSRLTARINEIRDNKKKIADLKVARVQVTKKAQIDYEERRHQWSGAVTAFNDNSEYLYDSPGSLIIDVKDTGYMFDVKIERSDSEGVGKMKIFCYDMMLAQVHAKDARWPHLLIHDSIVFDGVDSRQRAKALELAALRAKEHGFQYICALNSDMIPADDFGDDFDVNDYVALKLEDKDASGSLLGIRF